MIPIEFNHPEKREVPRITTHNFIGGSLDGLSKQATEHFYLTDKVIITIKDEQYQWIKEDTFKFIGKTHKAVFKKPSLKQKIIQWLFN